MRSPRRWLRGLAALGLLVSGPVDAQAESTIRFVRSGTELASWSVAELRRRCPEQTVTVAADPYYSRAKRYRACPLADVLELGFGSLGPKFAELPVVLRALDGYSRPTTGRTLLEAGGFLAFADAEREARGEAGFDPIDRRQVDPAPAYLIWAGADQNDTALWPWPYQLVSFEIARFEEVFPHAVPKGEPEGAAAWRGFAIFQGQCISCHAINGQGGRVGPDLNVPRSIVEYRPAAQIKAYVRDPSAFRYTSMPSHRHLDAEDLDALVAYFRAMSARKRDPGGPRH